MTCEKKVGLENIVTPIFVNVNKYGGEYDTLRRQNENWTRFNIL